MRVRVRVKVRVRVGEEPCVIDHALKARKAQPWAAVVATSAVSVRGVRGSEVRLEGLERLLGGRGRGRGNPNPNPNPIIIPNPYTLTSTLSLTSSSGAEA